MTQTNLPQELLDTIIFHAANQGCSLAPLLLVSRAFYYPTRDIIFRRVIVTFKLHRENEGISQLLDVFKTSSGTIQAVRHFVVTLHRSPRASDYQDGATSSTSTALTALLQHLSNAPITTLTLKSSDVYRFDFLWLETEVLNTLVAIRSKPSLRTLALSNLGNVPRPFITGNTQNDRVDELRMNGVSTICTYGQSITPFSPAHFSDLLSKVTYLIHNQPGDIQPIRCALIHGDSAPSYARRHWRCRPGEDHIPNLESEFPSLRTFVTTLPFSDTGKHYNGLFQLLKRAPNLESLTLEACFPLLPNLSEFSGLAPLNDQDDNLRMLPRLRHIMLMEPFGCSVDSGRVHHDKSIQSVVEFLRRTLGLDDPSGDGQARGWCPLALETLSFEIGMQWQESRIWPLDVLDLGEGARRGDRHLPGKRWSLAFEDPASDCSFGQSRDHRRPQGPGLIPSIQNGTISLHEFLDHPDWSGFHATVFKIPSLKAINITLGFYAHPRDSDGDFRRIILDKEDILRLYPHDLALAKSVKQTAEALGGNGRVEVGIILDTIWKPVPSDS